MIIYSFDALNYLKNYYVTTPIQFFIIFALDY